jgi:hypothetical protein
MMVGTPGSKQSTRPDDAKPSKVRMALSNMGKLLAELCKTFIFLLALLGLPALFFVMAMFVGSFAGATIHALLPYSIWFTAIGFCGGAVLTGLFLRAYVWDSPSVACDPGIAERLVAIKNPFPGPDFGPEVLGCGVDLLACRIPSYGAKMRWSVGVSWRERQN